MTHWVRTRSPLVRILVYAALAIMAFAVAAGVGAMGALMLRGDVAGLLERQGPRSADEQAVGRAQQKEAAEREEAASQQGRAAANRSADAAQRAEAQRAEAQRAEAQRAEAEYVAEVEEIQAGAVETLLDSHKKLLAYDTLAADDVEEMQANEAALRGMADRAADLDPPPKYEEQHDVFNAAIGELREAARLAHGMGADPVSAAELGFDEYDGRVDEASALLQRSNDLLGKDYAAIEDVREVSPEF